MRNEPSKCVRKKEIMYIKDTDRDIERTIEIDQLTVCNTHPNVLRSNVHR
jgi:hypothetical protein